MTEIELNDIINMELINDICDYSLSYCDDNDLKVTIQVYGSIEEDTAIIITNGTPNKLAILIFDNSLLETEQPYHFISKKELDNEFYYKISIGKTTPPSQDVYFYLQSRRTVPHGWIKNCENMDHLISVIERCNKKHKYKINHISNKRIGVPWIRLNVTNNGND